MTSPEGQIYNFEVDTGAIEKCPGQPDLQASGNIVMHLLSCVPRNNWHKLFIDNWYTSISLATTLMGQGIGLVGTVGVNRLKGCVLSNDKVMREKRRGSTEMKSCKINGSELRVIRWLDNRPVTILTTYEAVQPSTNAKRWDRKNKVEIQVSCPSAVVTYNKSMGGVDLLDGLLSYYRIPVKSKKWYHRLIWHFFDISVVQGWILYKRSAGKNPLSLKMFKVSVAMSLIKEGKSTRTSRGRPSTYAERTFIAKKMETNRSYPKHIY